MNLFSNPNGASYSDLYANFIDEKLKKDSSKDRYVLLDAQPGLSAGVLDKMFVSTNNLFSSLTLGNTIAASSAGAESGIIEEFKVANNFSQLGIGLLLPAVQSYTYEEFPNASYKMWVNQVFNGNVNLERVYKDIYVGGYFSSIDFMISGNYKSDTMDNASVGIFKERFVGMILTAGHIYWQE